MIEEKKMKIGEYSPSDESSRTIHLDDELTIKRIHEIFKLFSDSLEQESQLMIDMSKIERIDLSFFQLLYSLNKEAAIRNRVIHIIGPLKQRVKNVLSTAGFFSLHPDKATGFERDFYKLGL